MTHKEGELIRFAKFTIIGHPNVSQPGVEGTPKVDELEEGDTW
jgi:hypothetical protein